MANEFENKSGIEKCFNQYVSVWKDLFTNPVAFFEEESRTPSYQRIGVFAIVNFIAAGILGWLFMSASRDVAGSVRILISFPLAFALMSAFHAAVYLVCLRTIGTAAKYGELFKISLVAVSIMAILATFPLLLLPARIVSLVIFCIAFMGLYGMSIGKAIWATLTPLAFVIVLILFLSIMYRLLVPEYYNFMYEILRSTGLVG